jgi:hypothetical protein
MIIDMVTQLVSARDPFARVDLNNAQYTVSVEVCVKYAFDRSTKH